MIWLIGQKGMLGTQLALELRARGLDHCGTDLEVDIADLRSLRAFISETPVGWIVNCAAYTAVDRAEEETDAAYRINAEGAGNIALVAAEKEAKLIHISTDYVFDGEKGRPYTEEDAIHPSGVYARSKAEGEKLVMGRWEKSFVVRTSWLYGRHGKNFVDTMLRLMHERPSISVVDDQRGSPTYAADLAATLAGIVQSESCDYGIYHYTNEGETTWYGFASEIYTLGRQTGLLAKECIIKPIRSADYPAKVKRPSYSVLSKEKIKRMFHLSIPHWKDGLRRYLLSRKELSG